VDNKETKPISVLVVEDHPDQRDLLAIVLQREGYSVKTATDGLDALQVLQEENVDIILADIMMPKMDGFELIHKIRRSPKLKNSYFIFVTARIQEGDRVRGLDLGANDYITKPFSYSELLARVRVGARVARADRRPLNEAKLILVGRGGVGKTSVVNRLTLGKFFSKEPKTDGIRITHWPLRLNEKEDVKLNIWDFGGQEIMHATHQFFLSKRSIYLLVLNGREGGEDDDAEYWLKLIESFGGDSPVIVVLNKVKEHPFDVNRRTLQQKYPAIRAFIRTDCKANIGFDELQKTIERETDRLEHLRDNFPAAWFSIKNQLSGMKECFLSFDEYRLLCTNLGETDDNAQEDLATYLHNLGIVLNYKDDPRLQDTHVLNPQWVTNGVYKILNSNILEKHRGTIRWSELSGILDQRDYPPRMHRFLFDLMRKFNLCFPYGEDDTTYLIPELLDKQEPEDTSRFKPEECLTFQYHYTVLSEGLLPRFIVRTHVLSEGLPRWRTGVILRFEGNHALIKADVQDKKVFISVDGTTSGRRRLLAIIRADFERIHRNIPNLQIQEMVPLPEEPTVVVPYRELLVRERNRQRAFSTVIRDQIIDVSIADLLDGVDLNVQQRKKLPGELGPLAARLFLSYAHRDETLRNELETHLKLLERQGLLEIWHDRKIEAGDDWKREIDANLENAHIVLLLVSSDFVASDYCYEKEMKRALERHEKKETRVVPVIVRDVNWKKAPFAGLHALPEGGLPITKWADRDSAWRNVSEGIERVAEEIQKRPVP
jgi:internalin A